MVWLATIPYWAIGYNPIQEWVPGIFSIRARDWFSPLSHLTQIGGIGLAVLVFIIIWIRWTFPRLREDQLQSLAWRWLIPLALLNIVGTAVAKVVL